MSGHTGTRMHVLIDFSHLPGTEADFAGAVARLAQPDGVGGLAADITWLVPAGAQPPDRPGPDWQWVTAQHVDAARAALTRAGRAGHHLLVLSAALDTAAEAAIALTAAFARDPLFGAAHPRYARAAGGPLEPVLAPDADGWEVPRRTMLDLPAHYILPEHTSACFVLRDELLANVPIGDERAESVGGLLLDYLRKARRVGYRAVVANDVVVAPASGPGAAAIRHDTQAGLHADTGMAHRWFSRHADLARERRLAACHEAVPGVLIDARNIGEHTNGTTKAFLGMADALYRLPHGWAITLLATREAAAAHGFGRRYPDWTLAHQLPDKVFAAAFRPSQPWDLTELVELHHAAAVNAFLMLDNIAWDIVYTAPRRLDATWRFAARYADALLFISDFSRQRFAGRFPIHDGVRAEVCHLSLDPADYVEAGAGTAPAPSPYWFLVGNHYDHKHLQPTLSLVARAFPTTALKVLGALVVDGQVSGLASGSSREADVQALYAGAEVVIFPSLYEGFGLPVVNALAYGRTVVARDTALLREIAAVYRGPGRLVPFTTPDELVERLTLIRHGRPVPTVPLQQDGSGDATHGWQACAASVVAHLDALIRPRAPRREADRHEAVLLLDAWAH